MKTAHFINRQSEDGPGLRNLTKVVGEPDIWTSGFWDISEEDAQDLVGGMIYLHESKSAPSRFGGQVMSYATKEVTDQGMARTRRVEFTIRAVREGKGTKWAGADHAMAVYSGIVDDER